MRRFYYLLPFTLFACALSFGASAGLFLHGGTAQNVIRLSVPTLSNSTFTPGVPNGVVGTVSAAVSDGSPITYSVGGANSGGFQISGTTPPYSLLESASGTACGTYSDFYIQASAPTSVNSPQLFYPTITPTSSCAGPATMLSVLAYNGNVSPFTTPKHFGDSNTGTSWTQRGLVLTGFAPNAVGFEPFFNQQRQVIKFGSGATQHYWVVTANFLPDGSSSTYAIGETDDPNLDRISFVNTIDVSSITGTGNASSANVAYAWAPKAYDDNNGLPHIIGTMCAIAQGTCANFSGPFHCYEMHPTNPADLSQPWSAPVQIPTGSDEIIDCSLARDTSGTRYLFVRDATLNEIVLWTSASDFTNYSQSRILTELGTGVETPTAVQIGANWYLYAFFYSTNSAFPLNDTGYAVASSLNPTSWTTANGVHAAGFGGPVNYPEGPYWLPPNIVTALTMSCGSSCQFTSGTAGTVGTPTPTFSSGTPTVTYQFQLSGVDDSGTTCVDYQTPGYLAINTSTGAVSNTATAPAQSYPGVCIEATF